MRLASVLAVLAASFLAGTFAACTPPVAECSASNCNGCCDAAGQCQTGVMPQACGAYGAQCNACGGTAMCQFGYCTQGSSCTPATCASQGKNCGTVSDGCGGMLNCGSCSGTESCGGAGQANVCGPGTCIAKTCLGLGLNCGALSDGCAAQLNCGTCSGSDSCGGGGTANVCGQGACVSKTCTGLGRTCGAASDGCGGQLACGTCSGANTCGGGGTPGVCGQGACVPKSCTGLSKNCGAVSDGCGNTLDCGTCTGFETCGGTGTANVCGAACPASCPSGFTCSAGACAGGNLGALGLDVPVPPQHATTGSVTRNASAPVVTNCSWVTFNGTSQYVAAYLNFVHLTDTRYNSIAVVPCASSTTSAWTFSTLLYPGTYKVTVQKTGQSNLPSWDTVANASFAVTGPQSGVVFEVPVPPQHATTGSVTRNGVAPVVTNCSWVTFNGTSHYVAAYLNFGHLTDTRYNSTAVVPCASSTTSAWTFSTLLYPGTYKVTVQKTGQSNLPSWDTVANASFAVTGPQSGVVFEVPVPPQHATTGSVTRNGVSPVVTNCSWVTFNGTSQYVAAYLNFGHLTDTRYNSTAVVPCASSTTSAWTFSTLLYPGTYKVTLQKTGQSNLPSWDTVANASFAVAGPQSGVVFEVPVPPQHATTGSVTRNGVSPVVTNCSWVTFNGTSQYVAAYLSFVHATDTRYNSSAVVPCASSTTSAWTFSTQLYPGTYKVTVQKTGQSNLPVWDTVANAAFAVTGPQSGVVFEVPVPPQHATTGSVTRNGSAPVVTNCSWVTFNGTSQYVAAYLNFVHATDTRYNSSAVVPCASATTSAWTFSTLLYPGTYRVTVQKTGQSNLPVWDTVANAAFAVTGPQSGVVFEVPVPAQTVVAGTLTRNGAAPVVTNCSWVTFNGASQYVAAYLNFVHLTDTRYNSTAVVPCASSTTSAWTFTTLLYPGTYKVTVQKTGQSNLPSWDTVVAERLRVP